jgi:Skp family chaperone for outer membrane proteins
MKKIVILSLLLLPLCTYAQHKTHKTDTIITPAEYEKNLRKFDSSNAALDSSLKQYNKSAHDEDLKRTMEINNRNLDAFLEMQKERERKQRQSMWIRLAFGGSFLIIFIIGMIRKRKKKVTT